MRTLLLFRGAPGCGKSTYIKEHNLEQYVLSADTLRLMCQSAQETPAGQMEISPQNDDVVWEMLFKLLEVRMSHGEFTVIDATNSKTVEMNRYKNLAKQYRYRMYVINMTDLPIEECKRRNAQREWLKRVPEAAIDKMYARFATQKVPSGVTVLPSTTDVMSDLNYCPNDFNQWKKIHVIGDVHGCYTCLSEYLGEMKDDELYIFVGDYLDRGIENVEVFKFLCDVVNNNRKNVILLEGNHERWLNKWGHDEPVQSEEFANYTRPQLFKAGIDKNTARKIYSRVGQCAYFEYDGKRYFVSHGGLSYLPYFLPSVSADHNYELHTYNLKTKKKEEKCPVFNGNRGIIRKIESSFILVDFDQWGTIFIPHYFGGNNIWATLELAYALSCHKLQGSEAPYVIVGMDNSAYLMLTREWLYTAITRAKKYCVICAETHALDRAVKTSRVPYKRTFLKEFLRKEFSEKR